MVSELIKDIYPIIAKSAPVIASALGLEKLGTASMWALYLVGKAFGVNMSDLDKLPDVIANDPKSCDKLFQIEKSYSSFFDQQPNNILKSLNISNVEINIKVNFDQNSGLTSVTQSS